MSVTHSSMSTLTIEFKFIDEEYIHGVFDKEPASRMSQFQFAPH